MTHVDGDDYTWSTPTPDVRTLDQRMTEEICALSAEVGAVAANMANLMALLDIRTQLPVPTPAVLITRFNDHVIARHCAVCFQRVLYADEAIAILQSKRWAFVTPDAVGAVLDALGAVHA